MASKEYGGLWLLFMYTRDEPKRDGRQELTVPLTIQGIYKSGTWWLIGRTDAFRPKGRGLESRSSRNVGTLGKSFTHRCLWRFGVKLRHSIRAVSLAPLRSSGL